MKKQKPVLTKSEIATRGVFVRTVILMLLFGVVIFIPLALKLYQVQIIDHEMYQERAVRQQTSDTVLAPARGTIYDRNMKTLAVSASVDTVVVDPSKINSDAEITLISNGLARILELDAASVFDRIKRNKEQNRAYVAVKQKIERDESELVREFINSNENIPRGSVYLAPDTKRYYPYGDFASNTIGFVSTDGVGLEGLEARYNEQLTGTPGRIVSTRENGGTSLPQSFEQYIDATAGLNMVLTLDEIIQHFLEKHLATAVIENQVSKRALGIVMDVKTGGILAIATSPSFDLNNRAEITDPAIQELLAGLEGEELERVRSEALVAQYRNKAVSDTYEPGSTFKIITAAVALEEKVVSMDDRFSCGGSLTVAGYPRPMSCHKKIGHGAQSFIEGIQNSCNPVFITAGLRIGRQKFWDYAHAFGFYEKTGVDIPGESGPVIHSWTDYNRSDVTLATYSFGQTFNITPIQLITATSAVMNGGKLMQPHIVSAFTDPSGMVVQEVTPTVVRQVISEDTSIKVREALETVVTSGTGRNAYVKGYRTSGKTGTSQKTVLSEEERVGKYVVSFLGFAPADDPEIALLVALDEPGGPLLLRSGGNMGAPLAGRIMADILPYIGIKPQYSADDLAGRELQTPTLKGLSVDNAAEIAESNGLKFRVEGEGGTVIDQLPIPGVVIPATAQLVLYTESSRPDTQVEVPDVINKSPEQVNKLLTDAGLYIRVSGATGTYSTTIVSVVQDIPAGETVDLGTVVSVEFRDQSIQD
ncbi:MAG: penicillin-binding transpeptidase domain-containing protein [Oscillospiraceae bacterium]|nr:penicillin-binding transpeptidase domain-containing protein [Oscillospiraceae bacterium]